LLCATAAAWFAGSAVEALVFLHRGPLFHLLLAFPRARVDRPVRRARLVILAAAYVCAFVEPAGASPAATGALCVALVAAAVVRWLRSGGTERRAARSAAVAALPVCAALGAGVLGFDDASVVHAYELAVAAAAVGLAADVIAGRWATPVISELFDIGELEHAAPIAEAIGRAIGDPSVVIALPAGDGHVDEAGRPIRLPDTGVTPIDERGAVLVHDPAALADPELSQAAATAARIALANAGLEQDVAARVADLSASARRLVTASDDERRRLERAVGERAERRVAAAEALLAGVDPELARAAREARAQMRRFAAGLRPPRLAVEGLTGALEDLAAQVPVPVEIRAPAARYDAVVESSAYFVCSEALANVAKHAGAGAVKIDCAERDGALVVEVHDDGSGGADAAGSGLRSLADRVEALGGRLTVESLAGFGTTVRAQIPVTLAPVEAAT
jgi:hypothetical protein